MIVQPYKQRSKGARLIADALGCKLIRIKGTRYNPERGLVVNWGSSKQLFDDQYYINKPASVSVAADKYLTFVLFSANNVPTVEWTKDIDEAVVWCDDGSKVVQRDLIRSNSGNGIVMCDGENLPTRAGRLWTKYAPKFDEYRVHVVNGEVIDYVQKKRRQGVQASSEIRSSANGWVFCRGGVELPEPVKDAGVRAVTALGLDFGGADVGFTRSNSTARVYEVNTAPGVEGTTITRYGDALTRLVTDRARGDES